MMLKSPIKQLLLTITLLVVTIIVFEWTNLDHTVGDLFFDFNTHQWLIDRNNSVLALIFYYGPKKTLILVAIMILMTLLFFRKKAIVQTYKKGLLIVLLSGIFVPAVTIGLKTISNTPCPKNIEHYGGNYPNIKVFDSYPSDFKQECKIRCWPAGHASGGFALLSLFFLFKSAANRKRALLFALSLGWTMGMYKMLIGDHFLSHTIITMLLAWIIILIIYLLVERDHTARMNLSLS
jgi:membrane-associated PAP2 superfamily phosphatase